MHTFLAALLVSAAAHAAKPPPSAPAPAPPAVVPSPVAAPPAAPVAAAPALPVASDPVEGRSDSVVIQVRKLADHLAEPFGKEAGGGRYRRWAVVKFEELGGDVKDKQLGTVVASELENALQRDHAFVMIERLHIKDAMKELAFNEATGVDDNAAEKIAKLAGADALVVGNVALIGDVYRVNARVLSVNESKVVGASEVSIGAKGLIALSSDSVVLRSRSGAVFRSVLIPGWGQFYNRQVTKGWIVMGTAAALGGLAVGVHLAGLSAQSTYGDAQNTVCKKEFTANVPACVDNVRQTAQNRFDIRNKLLEGLAAAWALNLADAYLSGFDGGGAGGD